MLKDHDITGMVRSINSNLLGIKKAIDRQTATNIILSGKLNMDNNERLKHLLKECDYTRFLTEEED